MATETAPRLSPRTSVVALGAVALCIALLAPRLLSPPVPPSDREGCCDIVAESDVNAIKVMSELCGIVLQRRDGFTGSFSSGKLSREAVGLCRKEVNATCGIDIAKFLDDNVRLGRSFKQILDDVRSYNGSACLRMNYGLAPGMLGVPHAVGKFWTQDLGMRQERPSHLRPSPMHPAFRERGRAIVNPSPASQGPPMPPATPYPQRAPSEGRVRSTPLEVYYEKIQAEPLPVGGMRPPMGGAGGVIPPPKSSVGFVMPLYTLCIVIFFLYTVFKLLFRRQMPAETNQTFDHIEPDPEFRRKVFDERYNRPSPETNRLGPKERDAKDEELDTLRARLAETERAMERIVRQMRGPLVGQDASPHIYTNGTVHQREESPVVANGVAKVPSKDISDDKDVENEIVKEEKPEQVKEERAKEEKAPEQEKAPEPDAKVRSSVEKEKGTVKVLGMEMTAHCEGGQKWTAQRPATPPVAMPIRHPTPPVEVSSIYLEGMLPHQSRILVADSEILTEKIADDDDDDEERESPIVLSGKMTLSVINDETAKIIKEAAGDDDDEFTTASAATAPRQDDGSDASEEDLEEEETEEEVETEEEG